MFSFVLAPSLLRAKVSYNAKNFELLKKHATDSVVFNRKIEEVTLALKRKLEDTEEANRVLRKRSKSDQRRIKELESGGEADSDLVSLLVQQTASIETADRMAADLALAKKVQDDENQALHLPDNETLDAEIAALKAKDAATKAAASGKKKKVIKLSDSPEMGDSD